jgi:hypothetical protein
LGDSAIGQGGVRVTEPGVVTVPEERLHATSKLPEGRLTQGGRFGTARPNRACDDGIKVH